MDRKLITVFTPTYNRINLLPNCFESLKRQTCRDFLWLIVDDGSTDGTRELVGQWAKNSAFEIQYIYKKNGGLHTAYNAAIFAIETELAVCIDSDDYLTDDAIELISQKWYRDGGIYYAGMVALNRTKDNDVLGKRLPELVSEHIIDLYCKYNCRSDLKMIYRTDLLKSEGPIPVFGHEKHMNPYYLFLKIDKKLPMLILNQSVCVVNYQNDGMSTDIIRQYVESARSFAELRLMMVSMEKAPVWYILKNTVHLVSSVLLAKQPSLICLSPHRVISILMFIPGVLLAIMTKLIYRFRYQR
ncbi:MAG: glycosyltransferase family 2 protein [Roseburia sp.]|nr:glycosyltransferase family 2 protein [Roseburia sp.]